MERCSEADDLAAVHAFLVRVLCDRQAGQLRSLAEYQQLFPGHEEEISRRYAEAVKLDDEDPDDGPDLGRFGRFRLLRELGRGGQGVVYLAEDPQLNRRVALKVLLAVIDPSGKLLLRFRREAEAAGRIDHPGICAVHEAGDVEGTPYIAMRYVEGESLARKIAAARADRDPGMVLDSTGGAATEDGQRDPPSSTSRQVVMRVIHLLERVARAVHAAHEAGVVHRDLKPANIVITPEGDPVVLDFGLARAEQEGSPSITGSGEVFGTPTYMAPEQIEPSCGPTDRRTDVYALGATLHECLALRPPFEAPTREGLYRAILTHDPPDLRRANSALTADLKVVLETALAKEPDARYQTALDLAEELRRLREHEPIVARPAGPVLRLGRWAQRRPGFAAALAVTFLSLVTALVVTVFYLRESSSSLAEIRVLADRLLLPYLERRAERELWPAVPEKMEAMDAWLNQAQGLLTRREERGYQLDLSSLADLVPNVQARREHAATLWQRSIGDRREQWDEAIAAFGQSDEYVDFALTPQLGLVPLGPDPRSGFLEFAYLQFVTPGTGSARIPWRDPECGRLSIDEDTYPVFVLLPGGTFWLGAQAEDPGGFRFDGNALPEAGPPHQIPLDPFFLSKYEMTQAQWSWATGHNPSLYYPGPTMGGYATGVTLRNPVETVSWDDCADVLSRLELGFPTQAQWEYGCRAGTDTVWFTGNEPTSLSGYANVADEGAATGFSGGWAFTKGLFDGAIAHAPVGSYKPNGFGLHDMHGNVTEWCGDSGWEYDGGNFLLGTGERFDRDPRSEERAVGIYRGGSFYGVAFKARSCGRGGGRSGTRYFKNGIRPAISVR